MNVKKLAILSAFLTASLPSAAQDTVRLIINGEIRPITCTLQGARDRTITMPAKNISDFPNIMEVDGGVIENITLKCPQTTAVDLTVTDNIGNGQQSNNRQFHWLFGRNSNAASTTYARGFGVILEFLHSNQVVTEVSRKNMGSKNRLFTASGDDYATLRDRVVTVKPYYYRFSNTYSPGRVEAEATLTFDYP